MSCSVTVANSPMLSPPSSLFCNKSSMISPAPETLPLPPLPSGLASCSGPRSPVTQLKRKRPVKLCIPVVSLGFRTAPSTLSTVGRREMMVEDREGYYHVCCKRGRREALEDHYSASLNLEIVIWRDNRAVARPRSHHHRPLSERNGRDVPRRADSSSASKSTTASTAAVLLNPTASAAAGPTYPLLHPFYCEMQVNESDEHHTDDEL
ncbi:hypothetical protein ACFX2B_029683 [Malus domestica]